MPTFEISLPSGEKYHVDAPDENTAYAALRGQHLELDKYHQRARDLINDQAAKGRDISGGFLDKYLKGATMGFGDELVAGARTGLGAIVDPLKHIGDPNYKSIPLTERYNYEKALEDERAKDADRKTGVFGTIAELAGGLGTGVGAARSGLTLLKQGQTLGQMARAGALEGAGYGAVSGAGEGDGLNDRLQKAFKGGLAGGAIGGSLPLVAEGVKVAAAKPISNILAARDPQSAAVSKFAEDLRSSGKTLDEVKLEIDNANAAGIPITLADVLGKEGQRRLYTAAGAVGPGRDYATTFLNRRQAGQADRVSNILDEGLGLDQLGRPTARRYEEALTQVRKDAADRNYPAARRGAGEVDVTPVIDFANTNLVPSVNPARENSVERAVSDAVSYLRGEEGDISNFNQALQAKTEIQAILDKNPRASYILGPMLQRLDAALANASAGYRRANDTFARQSGEIDAIAAGQDASKGGRFANNIADYNALNPQGQASFRVGYGDVKQGQLEKYRAGRNAADWLLTPKTEAELGAMSQYQGPAMPGGNSPANEIERRLGLENTTSQTRNAVLGGSRTAENQADMESAGVDPRLFAALGQLFHGNVKGALSSGGQFVSTYGGGNTPAVREQLAKLYLSNGNVDLASLLRQANQQSNKWSRRQRRAVQGLLSAGAIGAGSAQ
ncbi:MAG: hypothetical protein EB015_11565 [Methylocystaceae bacterium]|nr:hypothetical protein [Methylocystaceae bacterium]